MSRITEAIHYMLGKDEFNLVTYLDHPLWQMHVRNAIFRVTMAVRFIGDLPRRVRRAVHIWQVTH